MASDLTLLLGTAITVAFVHTVLGPDHYVPFVAMASAGRWSTAKTTVITILCGLGHILSSVVLAGIGVAIGLAVGHLKVIESVRGEITAWLLMGFGFAYFVWGLHRAIRGKPHTHIHFHGPGGNHSHEHSHLGEHTHVHESANMTPWVLFTIFVFGPCEPLIPLLMYPAARSTMWSVALVAGVFGVTTIVTMLALVLSAVHGLGRLPLRRLECYSHALAGLAIFACGGAIKWMGL